MMRPWCDHEGHLHFLAEFGGHRYRRCAMCGTLETHDIFSGETYYNAPAIVRVLERLLEERNDETD